MNLIRNLIIAVGIVAGVIVFKNWRSDVEHQRKIETVKAAAMPFVKPAGFADSLVPDEAAFFKLQFVLQKMSKAGESTDDLLDSALEALGFAGGRLSMVKSMINEGYSLLDKNGVFSDVATLIDLERGDAPVVKSGMLRGQKLVLSQMVPALLAPELARQPANLRLVPEIIRDAHDSFDPAMAPGLLDSARRLRENDSMATETFERIRAQIPEKN